MPDDLVERLNARSKQQCLPSHGFLDQHGKSHITGYLTIKGEPLCAEAAARIEALEAENARLRDAMRPFAEAVKITKAESNSYPVFMRANQWDAVEAALAGKETAP